MSNQRARRSPCGSQITRRKTKARFTGPPAFPGRATPSPANGFSRITKHETRITAFYAFSVARMVLVGTEALQSCFFGRNVLWVDSADAVARNENLIHARRGRAGWGRQSRPSHFLSGIYETRDPRHGVSWARGASRREFRGFHETRSTRHETRLFQTRNTTFPWLLWCSLVLKPFSLFFPAGTA